MIARLREIYSDPRYGAVTVDVFSAFTDTGNVPALLGTDGAHPNEQGSQLWADTVWSTLGLGQAT